MSPRTPVQAQIPDRSAPWWLAIVALLLIGGVAWLDAWSGPRTSFTLLYLLPVGVAAHWIGPRAGRLAAVGAAVASLVIALRWPGSFPIDVWNAVCRLGVLLLFASLIDYLHRHELRDHIVRTVARLFVLCATAAGALAGLSKAVQHFWPAETRALLQTLGPGPQARLEQLVAKVDAAFSASRPLMLGSRDPNESTCVVPVKRGATGDEIPATPTDLNGGPGTSLTSLYMLDRKSNTDAMRDFAWHQKRLRSYLENQRETNRPAWERAHALSESVSAWASEAQGWTSLPADLVPRGNLPVTDWPSYCLGALDSSVRANDLSGVQRWSAELALACFSLDDLHRWLDFLCENQLAALDFQKECQGLFEWTQANVKDYQPFQTISALPAGLLSLNGWDNYTEVERQAERLYALPREAPPTSGQSRPVFDGSEWVPPNLRATYTKLKGVLSRANRETWDEAARAPYEHSYLVNMLYRASASDSTEALATVLKRFDAGHPRAERGELMNALMYRGHLFAGMEWSDRFDPALLEAAQRIPAEATDREALMEACRWTNSIVAGPADYASTVTLRRALELRKLDCVRATDMIGAIFRNSGRSRLGHVRWCAGSAGHSVAAYRNVVDGKLTTLLADGLNPPLEPESWPECYFHGHEWPAGMQTNPEPYAVELYVRGLDSYVWGEGYVIRGPQAGWFTQARVPYSKWLTEASRRKIFDGPFLPD